MYPFEEWERIEQKLAGLSTFNPTKKKFLDRVNYYGQLVEMDGQGRLLMPQLLREAAQIKGEVAVTGQPDASGSAQPGSVSQGDRGASRSRLRMRRRSTNWASSGRGFNKHPPGGWAWWKQAGHVPVLLKEAIDFLAIRRGGTYIDATVGLGGHSLEIAKRLGAPGHLIGVDKDPAALESQARSQARSSLAEAGTRDWPRSSLLHGSFAEIGRTIPTTDVSRRISGRPRRQQPAARRRRARL